MQIPDKRAFCYLFSLFMFKLTSMRLLLLSLLFYFPLSFAAQYKVMTFNTMCDFCNGSNYFDFNNRLQKISDILKTHRPELIALQEIRKSSDIIKLKDDLQGYNIVQSEYAFVSYSDPALLYQINRFQELERGQFWLGPEKGEFSFGWKVALPRQVHWVKLLDKKSDKEIIFASSHFDNRRENLRGAAKMVGKYFKKFNEPIIFAADTNITIDMPDYKLLTDHLFINSFALKKSFHVIGNYKKDRELCYTRKGKRFPECRVDHILLSSKHQWNVQKFTLDLTRYKESFPSDHRPVIIDVQLN